MNDKPICEKHPIRPCYACNGSQWRNKTTRCERCSFTGGTMPNYTNRKPCVWCKS